MRGTRLRIAVVASIPAFVLAASCDRPPSPFPEPEQPAPDTPDPVPPPTGADDDDAVSSEDDAFIDRVSPYMTLVAAYERKLKGE